ncbi:MAG: M4 family metallopeptidase [Roseiflexaceae bacterium]
MSQQTYPHSIFCILPPHMLREIAIHGDIPERTAALDTLATDQTFRMMRADERLTPATPTRASVLAAEGEQHRTIYSAKNQQNLPGVIVRAEGAKATGDLATDEAYDGLGATFDFFWEAYQRNSIDDQGLPLEATVHFGHDYDNAFWNGERMVFGDGDGKLFKRFTIALDVIGHELTHGVTQDEAQLAYYGQSGALNEAVSDVFGSLIKQHKLGQTANQADWLIGAGLLAAGVKGMALRSMKAPGTAYDDPVLGKDPQPRHMRDFVHTYQDNGGVHINSGIPNHAFYLAAVALGGNAWEKAGRIWYEALRDSKLRPNSGFRTFARLTVANAERLYGPNSPEQCAIHDSWTAVGVVVAALPAVTPAPKTKPKAK